MASKSERERVAKLMEQLQARSDHMAAINAMFPPIPVRISTARLDGSDEFNRNKGKGKAVKTFHAQFTPMDAI